MTKDEVTDICLNIYSKAKSLLPQNIASALISDKETKLEKTAVLGFSLWDKNKRGLWDRHYCSYHISYDPRHENCRRLWHIRLMYFRKRRQTGNGQFNRDMELVMRPLDTLQGFELVSSEQLLSLWRLYDYSDRDSLVQALPQALAWLIQATYPKIDAFLQAREG